MNDMEDKIIIDLKQSIKLKSQRCKELRNQLCYILDSKAAPLKDRIIDATIDDFSERRMELNSQCEHLLEELNSLKKKSEPLRRDIEGLEILKNRLEKALDVTNIILDIRSINSTLKDAIEKEDYEKATQLVVQFRSIVSRGDFDAPISEGVQTGGNILESSKLETQLNAVYQPEQTMIASIKASERRLIQIVGRKFREGVVRRDRQVVSDFAKLFYPLNLHKEGIYCYINFLRESMSNECASYFKLLASNEKHQPGVHSEVAGNVFMAVADLIQEHQKNVETQFGSETYLLFLRGLEEEADIQTVRILDSFESEHSTILLLTEDLMTNEQLRAVDLTLDELSSLSLRCQQFTEYLHSAGREIMSSVDPVAVQQLSESSLSLTGTPTYSPDHGLQVLSSMMLKLQELMGIYVSSEHSFASRSINRALQDAEMSLLSTEEPVTSTLPDDVFFMLRKCITRAIASCDVFSVCAIINLLAAKLVEVRTHLCKCLQLSARLYTEWLAKHFITGPSMNRTDLPIFAMALKSVTETRDFDPTEFGLSSVFGRAQPQDSTRVITTCSSMLSWPVCLNDLSACIDYVGTLVKTCEEEFSERWEVSNKFDAKNISTTNEKQISTTKSEGRHFMFQQSLMGFESTKKEFQLACDEYYQDFVTVMLQPVLVPGFRQFDSLNFNIDQITYADYQVNDPFMLRWISHLEALLAHLKLVIAPAPLSSIMEKLIDRLTLGFEESILKKRFTLLGAIQLEKDVRTLASSLITATSQQTLRYKFSRLLEISEVLNVGSVEELKQLSDPLALAKSWKLSLREIQKLMETRVDLPKDQLECLFNDPTFIEY